MECTPPRRAAAQPIDGFLFHPEGLGWWSHRVGSPLTAMACRALNRPHTAEMVAFFWQVTLYCDNGFLYLGQAGHLHLWSKFCSFPSVIDLWAMTSNFRLRMVVKSPKFKILYYLIRYLIFCQYFFLILTRAALHTTHNFRPIYRPVLPLAHTVYAPWLLRSFS